MSTRWTFSFQVSVSYNVLADPVEPQFTLNVKFTDETMNGFKVKICFR